MYCMYSITLNCIVCVPREHVCVAYICIYILRVTRVKGRKRSLICFITAEHFPKHIAGLTKIKVCETFRISVCNNWRHGLLINKTSVMYLIKLNCYCSESLYECKYINYINYCLESVSQRSSCDLNFKSGDVDNEVICTVCTVYTCTFPDRWMHSDAAASSFPPQSDPPSSVPSVNRSPDGGGRHLQRPALTDLSIKTLTSSTAAAGLLTCL